MTKLSSKSKKTIDNLINKVNAYDARMPGIDIIHLLLNELNIQHKYSDSVNIVEYRSKGKRYVNSRHTGKRGKEIEINNIPEDARGMVGNVHVIRIDTSSSYYSYNTYGYAKKILGLIKYYFPELITTKS